MIPVVKKFISEVEMATIVLSCPPTVREIGYDYTCRPDDVIVRSASSYFQWDKRLRRWYKLVQG